MLVDGAGGFGNAPEGDVASTGYSLLNDGKMVLCQLVDLMENTLARSRRTIRRDAAVFLPLRCVAHHPPSAADDHQRIGSQPSPASHANIGGSGRKGF